MRIRADCLKILGEHGGILVAVADRPGLPELRETVDGPSRSQLRDYLARRAETVGAPAGRVRLFALIGVELDTGARVGELAALTLADLEEDLSAVRVVRRPQARTVSEAVQEDREALRRHPRRPQGVAGGPRDAGTAAARHRQGAVGLGDARTTPGA